MNLPGYSTFNWRHLTHRWRWLPVQLGIVVTFALIPFWYRFVGAPRSFSPNYVTGFVLFVPMVYTVFAWLVLGLPGFGPLRRDPFRATWALALLALAVWAYASSAWALVRVKQPGVAQNGAQQLGLVILFVIAVASAGPRTWVVVGVLVSNLLWNSLIGGLQVAAQHSIGLAHLGEFPLGPYQPGVSVVQAGDLRWLRPYGLLPHPNMLAALLAIGLLASVALIVARHRWRRWLGTLIFLFGLWNFLLTFSRGAWLGFAAGVFVLYPLLRRRTGIESNGASGLFQNPIGRQVLLVLALTCLTGLAFFTLYRPLLSARAGIGDESVEQRSISDRVVFAELAYRSIAENPLVGLGISNFPWFAAQEVRKLGYDLKGDNVHQVLLSALAELGIVGYGVLVLALLAGVEAALRYFRTAPNTSERNAKVVLFAGFIALTIIGLLDHYPWSILQFQTAWWGLLAAVLAPASPIEIPPQSHSSL